MQANPIHSGDLPPSIGSFFAHQPTAPERVAGCFTEDAVVLDEGHEHRERTAIAAWNAAAVAKYAVTTEPLAAETQGARTTVRAKVSGTFPGSPIELRFRFTLRGALISRLEIGP